MRKKRKENNLKKESSPCYNVKFFLEIILLLDEEEFGIITINLKKESSPCLTVFHIVGTYYM